eukprot:Amastigsp_a348813_3.p5 type:complete len:110 gc:universal Amastigsp_a348813_3:370-699(+)
MHPCGAGTAVSARVRMTACSTRTLSPSWSSKALFVFSVCDVTSAEETTGSATPIFHRELPPATRSAEQTRVKASISRSLSSKPTIDLRKCGRVLVTSSSMQSSTIHIIA